MSVSGGADESGHRYAWTVTNETDRAIVELRFPHYRATLFFAPDGWTTDQSTNIVNVGVPDRPGVCVARASTPGRRIQPRHSATFTMQTADGAKRRAGTVTVRFVDGAELSVGGVELPHREGLGERYVSLIGLGAIFAAWMLARSLRRGSAAPAPATDRPSAEGKE